MKTWYLIQYTPDLQARESINVGVVVHDDHDNWAVRMVFVDSTGTVDRTAYRNLGGTITVEDYEGWVGYYTRAIMEHRWEQAATLHLRRKVNFHILKGGTILTDTPGVSTDARDLYTAVVSRKLRQPHTTLHQLTQRTSELLLRCDAAHREHVTLPAHWDGYAGTTESTVDFAFAVGTIFIEPLPLGGQHGGLRARDFHARASAARQCTQEAHFVVTYSGRDVTHSPTGEGVLLPIRAVATTIDLDAPESALPALQQLFSEKRAQGEVSPE